MTVETIPHVRLYDLDRLTVDERNARTHDDSQIVMLEGSLRRFGWTVPMMIEDERGNLIRAGHGRRIAARNLWARGEEIRLPNGAVLPRGKVPGVDVSGWSEDDSRAYALADNQLALQAGWDDQLLRAELAAVTAAGIELDDLGFDSDALAALEAAAIEEAEGRGKATPGRMAAEFLIPPFSVLSAREGWWQERKRQWIALGIQSEIGRGGNLIGRSLHEQVAMAVSHRSGGQAGGQSGVGAHYSDAKRFIDERRARGMTDSEILAEAQGGKDRGRAFGQDILDNSSGVKPARGPRRHTGAEPVADQPGQRAHHRSAGRAFNEDIARGEVVGSKDWTSGRKPGLGGVTMDALSSHPRYYEQKTAAEARLGRVLTNEEFERDHWVLPDSQLSSGTSIFDPVLCEIAYRWFCPPAGLVIDPFAGGSVRGIVAAALGRRYVGVDLREEQIAANREQWPQIKPLLGHSADPGPEVSPLRVDEIEGVRVVRDDLVLGGTKRRALDRVLARLEAQEFVYASPAYGFAQIALAYAARAAGKRAVIVVAARAKRHPRTQMAADAGAEIVEVRPGYLTVCQKRAADLAVERGAYLVPFGMEDEPFIDALAEVAAELPGPAPTEIWSVAGSGVLTRALQRAWPDAIFHAVQIGKEPRIGRAVLHIAPERFEDDAREPPPFPSCGNYDAKAWRFIREHASPGALFWNVGADPEPAEATGLGPDPEWHVGDSLTKLDELGLEADFIFSCPPYGDLEVYSDVPGDLSTLGHEEFDRAYAEIVAKAVSCLKQDRFAVFVVGDYREKGPGFYRRFVAKTEAAFEAAGARLYNECILLTSAGSLAIRAGKQFRATRKVGKTHQNVLVFCKGDPRKATEALGPVDVTEALRPYEEAELEPDLGEDVIDEPLPIAAE